MAFLTARRMRLWILGVCPVVMWSLLFSPPSTLGQAELAKAKEFASAVRQIEAPADKDDLGWHQAEAKLQRALGDPELKNRAICALAWLHLRRGNTEAIRKFTSRLQSLFPNPSPDLHAMLGRIQLHFALVADPPSATKHFLAVSASASDPTVSELNRIASAAMLGSIAGMFEPEAAESPLEPDVIDQVRSAILKLPMPKVIQAFDDSYKRNSSRSMAISEWLVKNSTASEEERLKLAETELEQLSNDLEASTQELQGFELQIRSHRKDIAELKQAKAATQKAIQSVQSQWNSQPEIHHPIEPNRHEIGNSNQIIKLQRVHVGWREKDVKKTRFRNGREETYTETERVPEYEIRRRPQLEIDADIDRIYQPLLQKYRNLMARQQAILDQKATLERQLANNYAEIVSSEQKIDSIEAQVKSIAENRRDETADLKKLKDVSFALKAEHPKMAFRPPHFEVVDRGTEIKILNYERR
jgi:hypothetical protein